MKLGGQHPTMNNITYAELSQRPIAEPEIADQQEGIPEPTTGNIDPVYSQETGTNWVLSSEELTRFVGLLQRPPAGHNFQTVIRDVRRELTRGLIERGNVEANGQLSEHGRAILLRLLADIREELPDASPARRILSNQITHPNLIQRRLRRTVHHSNRGRGRRAAPTTREAYVEEQCRSVRIPDDPRPGYCRMEARRIEAAEAEEEGRIEAQQPTGTETTPDENNTHYQECMNGWVGDGIRIFGNIPNGYFRRANMEYGRYSSAVDADRDCRTRAGAEFDEMQEAATEGQEQSSSIEVAP